MRKTTLSTASPISSTNVASIEDASRWPQTAGSPAHWEAGAMAHRLMFMTLTSPLPREIGFGRPRHGSGW